MICIYIIIKLAYTNNKTRTDTVVLYFCLMYSTIDGGPVAFTDILLKSV